MQYTVWRIKTAIHSFSVHVSSLTPYISLKYRQLLNFYTRLLYSDIFRLVNYRCAELRQLPPRFWGR